MAQDMQLPTLREETQLWNQGIQYVAGVDEVGRGPLAGPVVAAAVVIQKDFFEHKRTSSVFLPEYKNSGVMIRDSKKLSMAQREKVFNLLVANEKIDYGIGIIHEKIIDQINILKASLLAMRQAVRNLRRAPDFLLLDGQYTLEDLAVNQKAVVHGDSKVFSIATASIIAKVTRDRLMAEYGKSYTQYGFEVHKGYGTKAHLEALKKYGPCAIHRRTFGPVKKIIKKKKQYINDLRV